MELYDCYICDAKFSNRRLLVVPCDHSQIILGLRKQIHDMEADAQEKDKMCSMLRAENGALRDQLRANQIEVNVTATPGPSMKQRKSPVETRSLSAAASFSAEVVDRNDDVAPTRKVKKSNESSAQQRAKPNVLRVAKKYLGPPPIFPKRGDNGSV